MPRVLLAFLLLSVVAGIFTVLSKGQYCLPIFAGAAQDVWQGIDPYILRQGRPDLFKYTLIWSYLLTPFYLLRELSPLLSELAWYFTNVGFWLVGMLALWAYLVKERHLLAPLRGQAWGYVALTLLAGINGVLTNGFYGQINSILVGLIALAFYLPERGRRAAGAFCLALATLMKLFPVAFVVFFLLRRRWIFLRDFVLLTVGLALFPLLHLGWDRFIDFNQSFIQLLFSDLENPPLKHGLWAGLSLHWRQISETLRDYQLEQLRSFYELLRAGAGLAFLLLLMGWFRVEFRARKDDRILEGLLVGLLAVFALLFSHMTESPTLVLLTLAYPALAATAFAERSRVVLALFLGSYILSSLLSSDMLGSRVRLFFEHYLLKTVGLGYLAAVLVGVAAARIWKLRRG